MSATCMSSCMKLTLPASASRPPSHSFANAIRQERALADSSKRAYALVDKAVFLGYSTCFTKTCQDGLDQQFILALAIPVVVAVASVAWLLRPPPEGEDVFQDPDTGSYFQAAEGKEPARDRTGELAFRAVSFTPFPVEADVPGERIRIPIGPAGACEPRTFVFDKLLEPSPPTPAASSPPTRDAAQPSTRSAVTVADLAPPAATVVAAPRRRSELVTVTLERPLGLIIEEDVQTARAVVADVVEGSRAAQRVALAGFDRARRAQAALPGDIVRAFTATNLVYPTKSLLFGMQPPQRQVVVFGADGQRWERVSAALKQGLVEDGPVTLVLERLVEDTGR